MRILVAEDDAVSRSKLEFMLTKWGWEVVAVSDGAQALDALEAEGAPRLAILDWEMPQLSGVEVCQKVRELAVSGPRYLLLLTSKSDKRDIVRGLHAGANDYLTKPCDWDELRARIGVGVQVLELQQRLSERV